MLQTVHDTPSSTSSGGFKLVIKWSGILLIIMIAIGLSYRLMIPVQLHLDENEYIKRVFAEADSRIWIAPDNEDSLAGKVEGGTLFYVIDENAERYLVRPFNITGTDSVWIDRRNVIDYSRENYRQWQREEEKRKFGLDE